MATRCLHCGGPMLLGPEPESAELLWTCVHCGREALSAAAQVRIQARAARWHEIGRQRPKRGRPSKARA